MTRPTAEPTRRCMLQALASGLAGAMLPAISVAATMPFERWVAAFRGKAMARGITAQTYSSVMDAVRPDLSAPAQSHSQPEFHEQLWQYLNRRVSDWRVIAGRQKAKQYAPLFARIERDFGVERSVMLGVWGIESTFGDPLVQEHHMRPVFPALAALAFAEPRRRPYWESQLIDALEIVQRGWATPHEMVGSWAGAMGHTQWMPEVWLHIGIDYNHDGKVSPFGPPDDALGSSARFLVQRGRYRRGEHWGYEVRVPEGAGGRHNCRSGARTYAAWRALGVGRADGEPFPQPEATARLWVPVPGGPAFLLGPNFFAVKTYNPSMNYTLALVQLGDRCVGGNALVQKFPGSERAPTLAEVEEIQRRLTALGYKTGGVDGRVGNDTMLAVQAYQRKSGIRPADGYAGVGLLARLRGGL